jgi:hypothetical protein
VTRIYLASAYSDREHTADIARTLRGWRRPRPRVSVLSTWHDGPAEDESAMDVEQKQSALRENRRNIRLSDAIIVLAMVGAPLETWCELVYAQHWSMPALVLAADGMRLPLSAYAPGVTLVTPVARGVESVIQRWLTKVAQ